jgi:hypothetical protein
MLDGSLVLVQEGWWCGVVGGIEVGWRVGWKRALRGFGLELVLSLRKRVMIVVPRPDCQHHNVLR